MWGISWRSCEDAYSGHCKEYNLSIKDAVMYNKYAHRKRNVVAPLVGARFKPLVGARFKPLVGARSHPLWVPGTPCGHPGLWRGTYMLSATKQTVFLIEADASLRRLIALGLQYRGMHVIEVNSPTSLPTIDAQQPSLLVLDVDGRGSSDWSLLAAVQAEPSLSALPVVVLAWECVLPVEAQVTCLTKPFDARTLQATIEQLLTVSTAQAAAITSKEEILLAAQTANPAPSICPLITAAGSLLAFIV